MSYYVDEELYNEAYEDGYNDGKGENGIQCSIKSDKDNSKNVVNIEFNTDVFLKGMTDKIKHEIQSHFTKEIEEMLKRELLDEIRSVVKESAGSIMRDMLNDYIDTEVITISKNYWDPDDDEKAGKYTIRQYFKQCMKEMFEKGELRTHNKSIDIEEYITKYLGIDGEVKRYIDSQMCGVKKDVNRKIRNLFDESTKQLLADNVVQILMANDTYKKIQSSISDIASK